MGAEPMELIDKDVPGPRRDFVGYGRRKPKVTWPHDAKAAVQLIVNYEEGAEYSWPSGDGRSDGMGENYVSKMGAEYRDLKTESTYEYGSRAGIWRLLSLFAEYDIKVTFFACAVAVERNPEVGQWIAEAGHEVCGHGWRFTEHWRLDREEERKRLAWTVESLERTCGTRPRGWFSRSSPSVNTRELLVEEGGFLYDADSVNDDLPYHVEVLGRRHLIVPYTEVYNDGRFIRGQGYGSPDDFFESCRQAVDELRHEGHAGFPKMMSIGLHPRWIGQAGRTHGLRNFIEYSLEKGDVWFARGLDIAQWWEAHHAEFPRELL